MSQTQTPTDEQGQERQSRRQTDALRLIRKLGDPVLRETAPPVVEFERELAKMANKMIRIMHDAPGVGLAATQLGYMWRMLVYDVDDGPQVLVNPEIVEASAETEVGEEGCLSIPGARMPVERSLQVRVTAQDVRGQAFAVEAEGLEARVIQHELDHLNGVLVVDRTTREARTEALRQLRETVLAGDL